MRSNQQNKRSRGRNNNNNRKNSNPLTRSYESNGPDVRVRGNAAHVAEKYMQMARDANSAGDSVAAENYLQHAEHYFRIISAAQAQQAQQQAQQVQQQAQIQQGQRQQENRDDKSGDAQPNSGSKSAEVAATGEAAAPENTQNPNMPGDGAADQGQQKPQRTVRERRPRRRPVAEKSVVAGEGKVDVVQKVAADPANAPQPDVSELPAFVTADADSSAAE